MPGKKVKIGYTVEVVKLQNVPKELIGDGVTVYWKKKSKKSKAGGLSKGQQGRTVPVVVHSSSVVFDKKEDQSEFVVESHVLKDMASMKLSPSKKLQLAVQVERIQPLDGEVDKKDKKSKKKDKKAANSKLELGSLEIDLNAHAADGQVYRLDGMLLHDMPNFLAASRTTIDVVIHTRWLKFDGMRCVMAQPIVDEDASKPTDSFEPRKKASQRQSVVGAQWQNLISNVGHLTKTPKPQVVPDGSPNRKEKTETMTVDGMEYELADTETDISIDDTSYMDGTFTASEMDFTADDLSDDEMDTVDFPDDADELIPKPESVSKDAAESIPIVSTTGSVSKRKKLRRLSQQLGSTFRDSMKRAKPSKLIATFVVEILEANDLPASLDGKDVYISWKRGSEATNSGQTVVRKAGTVADESVAVSWLGVAGDEATMKFQCSMLMDARTEMYKEKLLAIQIRKKRRERRSSTPGKPSSGSAVAHTSVNLADWLDGQEKDVSLSLETLRSKKSPADGHGELKPVELKLRVSCSQKESKEDNLDEVEQVAAASVTKGRVFGRQLDDVIADDLPGVHVPTLVDSIAKAVRGSALTRQGLFRISGSGRVVKRIIQHFDFTEPAESGEDLSEYGPHELCDVLKKFVRQLSEPLVTARLIADFIAVGETLVNLGPESAQMEQEEITSQLAALVQQLPVNNFALLEYLLEFLLEVSEYSEGNKMTIANLATVWGPTALPTVTEDPLAQLEENPRKVAVFSYLLSFWSAVVHTDVAPKSVGVSGESPSLDALIELLDAPDDEPAFDEDGAEHEQEQQEGFAHQPELESQAGAETAEEDEREVCSEKDADSHVDVNVDVEGLDEEHLEDEQNAKELEEEVEVERKREEKVTAGDQASEEKSTLTEAVQSQSEFQNLYDDEDERQDKSEDQEDGKQRRDGKGGCDSEEGAEDASEAVSEGPTEESREVTDDADTRPTLADDASADAIESNATEEHQRSTIDAAAFEELKRKDKERARKLATAFAELKQLKKDMKQLRADKKTSHITAQADAQRVEEERRTERAKRQAERAQEKRRLKAASDREKARRAAEKELLVKMKAEMEEQAREKEQVDVRVEQLRYQLARSEEKAAAMKTAARAQLNEEALQTFIVEHVYLSSRAWDEENEQPKTVTILLEALWPRVCKVDVDSCRRSATALREVFEAMRKAHKRTRDGLEWNCYWLSCLTYLVTRLQEERGGQLLFSGDVRNDGLQIDRMADISPLWEIAPSASLLSAAHVEEQLQLLSVFFYIYLLDGVMGVMIPLVTVFLADPQGKCAADEIIDPLTSRLDEVLNGLSVHKLLPSVKRQLMHSLFSSVALRLLQMFREEPNLCMSQTGISIKLNLCSLNYWIDAHPSAEAKDCLRNAMTAMEPVEQAANLLVTCTNTALFASGDELCESFPALAADNVQFILQNFIPVGLTREERDQYDAITTTLILDLHTVVEAEQRAMAAAQEQDDTVDDSLLLLSDSEEELVSGLTSDLE